MKVIVKLGGVNGSGKTTVARAIMKAVAAQEEPWVLRSGKPVKFYAGSWNGLRVAVLGKYETACGGMDTISDKDDRLAMVEAFASNSSMDIVFFEGLITGKTYGEMGGLSEAHHTTGTARWLYTFMDTPFDVAVERVLARRRAAGNTAPFDPERTLRPTFNSCVRLEAQLRGKLAGRIPITVDHPVLSLAHKSRPATLAKRVLTKAEELFHAGF